MGSLGALGMADQVSEGNISLQRAVSWHLSSNHYPPHPPYMVPVALAAIEAGNEEEWDRDIELPKGCVEHKVVLTADNAAEHASCETDHVVQWRDREDGLVRAGDVIESFHLDGFINIPDGGPDEPVSDVD